MHTRALNKYAMLLPALIIVVATTVFPAFFNIAYSFREWVLTRSLEPTGFVGFDNYTRALSDGDFWNSFIVSGIYTVLVGVLSTIVGLVIAVLLQKPTAVNQWIKPLLIFPFAISLTLAGYSFRFMLANGYGIFDYILTKVIPPLKGIIWLADPAWALFWLSIPLVWQWGPLAALMFLGAMGSISDEVYEAARIDGATPRQIFWQITFKLLQPTILVTVLLNATFSIRMFDLVRTMTAGGPGRATETLNYFIYRIGFSFFDVGYASALSVILTVIMMILAYIYARALLRGGRT